MEVQKNIDLQNCHDIKCLGLIIKIVQLIRYLVGHTNCRHLERGENQNARRPTLLLAQVWYSTLSKFSVTLVLQLLLDSVLDIHLLICIIVTKRAFEPLKYLAYGLALLPRLGFQPHTTRTSFLSPHSLHHYPGSSQNIVKQMKRVTMEIP